MSVKRLHRIEAELGDNRVVQTELTVERLPSRDWALIAAVPGLSDIAVTGGDLFECLRALKLTTDPTGIRLLCNGARSGRLAVRNDPRHDRSEQGLYHDDGAANDAV